GTPATSELAFNSLAKGGSLILVGLFGGAAPWSLPLIPLKAARIQGSYTGNLAEFVELIGLVRAGKVAAPPILRRPFSDATDALESLREGKVVGRTVLGP
ncbi:MAG: alcohol dehydrogenase, partial [Rhodospirillales bacterium]|nr:alcohol dehydrogenase [Rhodospirillales bacterium]